jgi:hypothetical protein
MRENAPASAQADACQADESDNLKPEELKIDTIIDHVKNKK